MNIVINIFLLKSQLFSLQVCVVAIHYMQIQINLLEVLADYISSFTPTGKCVPFDTFLCTVINNLSKSACLGKYLCTKL